MIRWTAEELAEMAAADAEIEEEFIGLTPDEREASRSVDSAAVAQGYGMTEKQLERQREVNRKYYRENKENCLRYQKQYDNAHKEKIKAYKAQWYQENKARLSAKEKARWDKAKENPELMEKVREKSRDYYARHREEILAKRRAARSKKKQEVAK